MTSAVEAGMMSVGVAVAAAALLASTRTRWLRLDVEKSSHRFGAPGFRVSVVGLLTGAAVVAIATAAALSPDGLTNSMPWTAIVRTEVLAAVGLVLLVLFLDSAMERSWLLLGAGIAAGTAWIGHAWLQGMDLDAGFGAAGMACTAAAGAALLLSRGPTARLVSRARHAATGEEETHLLLADASGRVRYAAEPTRDALGVARKRSNRPSQRESLPKVLHEFLDDPSRETARVRTSAGRILEARMLDVNRRGALGRTHAMLLSDVTSAHRDKKRLVRLAHYDSLTGLANRRLFLDNLKKTLDSSKAKSQRAALFYIDLDDFKTTNDSLGHAAGDDLLKALATRFKKDLSGHQVTRFGIDDQAGLMVARLAGDEFAIIAAGAPDQDTVGELARFILDVIRKPVELTHGTLNPSASIGIALFPEHAQDVQTLLRHADSALYVAKSRGRQRYAWYEASLDAKADRARLIEEGLKNALERDEMRLHYQPKIHTKSGVLVGFEALLRWKSPDLGDVGPGEFIPVAEARGLVSKLGSWCLDEACRQMQAWQQAGLSIVPVSVNVSSIQFADTDLQREVSAALQRYEIDPHNLELELTESLLLDERNQVEQVLRDLRTIGVRVALDDFGTGYSALTYLNRFSLDVLKMDRGLLRDIDTSPTAMGIASAVVAMAHSVGLSVVAEGVDMEEQIPILREMDCDQIQGFLYAPALPAEEVAHFMNQVGENPLKFGPGMTGAGGRTIEPDDLPAIADQQPALRTNRASKDEAAGQPPTPTRATKDKGRVLLVDDGQESLGTVALRLVHLGVDIHYASAIDEAHLFVAQEKEAIRLIAFPPNIDLTRARSLRDSLTELTGETTRCIVIGEQPDDESRADMRKAGVDWVLWAPFNDAELRSVVKNAMIRREDLVARREARVPVDLIANIWTGGRREVAVVSSLSPRGAFIELTEPLEMSSSLRIEIDLGTDRLRGFARVVHVQTDDPERPNDPSGVGVTFYGVQRDEERLLRKAVSELHARYLP